MESSDHRAEPVLEKRLKRNHTLLRDVLPPLETLIVTVEGTGETEGIFALTIPNRLLEEWANSRSTETNFVALVNARIEGEMIAFDPEAARLETQLYNRSLGMVSKLRKIGGAKRKNVLLGSTKLGVLKGEILSRAELMIERDETNYLLAEADAMMQDLLREMGDAQEELAEAYECFATFNSHEGSKIDELSSLHARRKMSEIAESVGEALDLLPSYGLTPDSLKVRTGAGKSHTIALSPRFDNTDSCNNLKILYLLDKYGVSDMLLIRVYFLFPFQSQALIVPLLFTPPPPLIPIYHQPSRIENVFITCFIFFCGFSIVFSS